MLTFISVVEQVTVTRDDGLEDEGEDEKEDGASFSPVPGVRVCVCEKECHPRR